MSSPFRNAHRAQLLYTVDEADLKEEFKTKIEEGVEMLSNQNDSVIRSINLFLKSESGLTFEHEPRVPMSYQMFVPNLGAGLTDGVLLGTFTNKHNVEVVLVYHVFTQTYNLIAEKTNPAPEPEPGCSVIRWFVGRDQVLLNLLQESGLNEITEAPQVAPMKRIKLDRRGSTDIPPEELCTVSIDDI